MDRLRVIKKSATPKVTGGRSIKLHMVIRDVLSTVRYVPEETFSSSFLSLSRGKKSRKVLFIGLS